MHVLAFVFPLCSFVIIPPPTSILKPSINFLALLTMFFIIAISFTDIKDY